MNVRATAAKQRPPGYQTLHDANAAYYESEDTGHGDKGAGQNSRGNFSQDSAAMLKVTEGTSGQHALLFPSIGPHNPLKRMPLPQIPKRKTKLKTTSLKRE